MPVGTFKGTATENDKKLSLLTTKGTTETSRTLVSLAQETHQDNYLARFVSESLSAQTIAGNTWSFGISTAQDSGFAESFFAISLYVYRPSTDTVVGYITDSDTPRGTEWANNKEGRTFTISGSAVTAQAGDVLVREVWRHAEQSNANARTNTIYFDGTVDVTEESEESAASYLETSQNLTFGVAEPTTPIGITRQASWGSGAG